MRAAWIVQTPAGAFGPFVAQVSPAGVVDLLVEFGLELELLEVEGELPEVELPASPAAVLLAALEPEVELLFFVVGLGAF